MKKPIISKELKDYLCHIYGNISINIDDSLQQVFYKAGQESVVRHINQLYEKQQEEKIIKD